MDRRYLRRLIKSKLKKNRRLTRISVSKTTSPSSEFVFSTESSERMLDDKSEASDEDDIDIDMAGGWWFLACALRLEYILYACMQRGNTVTHS